MGLFKKKELKITQMPTTETQETKISDSEDTNNQEQEQISIKEVSLRLTEHEFKEYVIAKLEEITQRLK